MHAGETSPLLNGGDEKPTQSQRQSLMDIIANDEQYLVHLIEDESEKDKNFSTAARIIRDVILGDPHVGQNWSYSPWDCNNNEGTSRKLNNEAFYFAQRILSNRYFMGLIKLSHTMLIILSFIEQPFWCQKYDEQTTTSCDEILQSHGPPAFLTGYEEDEIIANDRISDTLDVSYYPTWNMAILDPMQSYAIEFICIISLIGYVVLLIMRDGSSLRMFFNTSTVLRIMLVSALSIMVIDLTLIRPFQNFIGAFNGQIIPLFLRIVIHSTFSPSVISEIKRTTYLIPHLMNIIVVLFVLILIYAWIGNIIFFGTREGSTYFNSLSDSWWTLYTTLTYTYPYNFLSIYESNRLSSIYFTSFMVLANVFLMNVILGAIYENYTNLREGFAAKQQEEGVKNLKKAYKLLKKDDNGEVSKNSIMALFCLINQNFPGMRYVPDEEAEVLFDILDNDNSDGISEEEFLDFQQIMFLHFTKLDDEGKRLVDYLLPNLSKTEQYKRFKDYILSETFNKTIDFLLVLNAVLIVYQNLPLITGNHDTFVDKENLSDGGLDSLVEYCQLFFTIAFVLEMILKILVLGWIKYAVQHENMFDFVVTITSLAATVMVYCFTFFNNGLIIRLVNSVRVLRLTRLLKSFPQFRVMSMTFFDIAKPASKLLEFLVFIIYLFSSIGLVCFGGYITRDPKNPNSYLLEGSDFAEQRYWPNNFNDMMSGVVILFNLMMYDSDVQASAFELVAGTAWTRLYFIAYFILVGIFVSNIVIAVIMEKFVEAYNEIKDVEANSSKGHHHVSTGEIFESNVRVKYLVKLNKTDFSGKNCNLDNILEPLRGKEKL